MTFSCQTCNRRKIKCDKASPVCSSCHKSKLDCRYVDPVFARNSKRQRPSQDDLEARLNRYESILLQNGLLPQDAAESATEVAQTAKVVPTPTVSTARGELIRAGTRTRYVESPLWRSLGPNVYDGLAKSETLLDPPPGSIDTPQLDPLSAAVLQSPKRSLLVMHPTVQNAKLLWRAYLENCEPLCKIVHVPSTTTIVEAALNDPAQCSSAHESLLFALYHFAVFSSTDSFCSETLGMSRDSLLHTYDLACRQALVNADWLQTTELSVLQALLLYLIPTRYACEPNTFWLLCGSAVRLGQRMGLHKDLHDHMSPFDVQMRRRISFQLLLVDGMATRMVGCGSGLQHNFWESKIPSSIDDDQIWPEMTVEPVPKSAATDMIFCLIRSDIHEALSKMHSGAASGEYPDNVPAMDANIDAAEAKLEEKYVRYCDATNPLHFLSMCMVRAAITYLRLRARLPSVHGQNVSQDLKKELFKLSMKLLETDSAACAHHGLARFRWHTGSFFLYGSWDSLLCILNALGRNEVVADDIDTAWARVEQVFSDRRGELLESKQVFHVAIGRLALQVWEATRQSHVRPVFIRELVTKSALGLQPVPILSADPSITDQPIDLDLNMASVDWLFWDRMIKDYQAQHY